MLGRLSLALGVSVGMTSCFLDLDYPERGANEAGGRAGSSGSDGIGGTPSGGTGGDAGTAGTGSSGGSGAGGGCEQCRVTQVCADGTCVGTLATCDECQDGADCASGDCRVYAPLGYELTRYCSAPCEDKNSCDAFDMACVAAEYGDPAGYDYCRPAAYEGVGCLGATSAILRICDRVVTHACSAICDAHGWPEGPCDDSEDSRMRGCACVLPP